MKTLKSISMAVTVIAILLLSFSNSFAQYQESSYDTKCNNISGDDHGRSIINRLDGGYAIAGFNYLANCGIGPYDWMFLRLFPTGIAQSVRLLGTAADDKCYSIVQPTNDSGYLMAGYMYKIPGLNAATLVKLNKSGGLVTARQIDDTVNSKYFQVVRDPGNTTGYTGFIERKISSTKSLSKLLVSQYNSAVVRNWAFRYDTYISANMMSKSNEEGVSLCVQPVGGLSYGVAVKTNRFSGNNGWDIMIVKLNYAGGVIWNKIYRINIAAVPYASATPSKIIPMSDGGFTVVGTTNAYGQQNDIIVLRVNASGNIVWSYTYGSTASQESGLSIIQDGTYFVITGFRQLTATATPDALLMKIPTAGGAPVYTKLWDTGNSGAETGHDLVNSTTGAAGGYAITGDTYRGAEIYNPFLWRPNDNGQIPGMNCQDSISLPYVTNPHRIDSLIFNCVTVKCKQFNPMIVDPTVLSNTYCLSTGAGTSPTGTELDNSASEITEYSLKQNYPNPFNPVTRIQYELPKEGYVSVKIFDISGKEVMSLVNENRPQGRFEIEFDGSQLSSGVYYYKLISGNFTDVKKMILLK